MSIQPVRFSARDKLSLTVRSSVLSSVRNHSKYSTLVNKWPAATYRSMFAPVWRNQMFFTAQGSKARISTWIPSWAALWKQSHPLPTPATPTPSPSKGSDSNPSGRKKLRRKDIKSLTDEYGPLLTHGTRFSNVATGEVPLQAETEQSNMSNPVQQIGVYAYVGIESSRSYGPYGVLIKPGAGWGLPRSDGARIFSGTDPVPEDQILGYFDYNDLD